MKYLFNYKKYLEWRMKHDKLTLDDLCLLNRLNHMKDLDGQDRNVIQNQNLIILKDWCDETEG